MLGPQSLAARRSFLSGSLRTRSAPCQGPGAQCSPFPILPGDTGKPLFTPNLQIGETRKPRAAGKGPGSTPSRRGPASAPPWPAELFSSDPGTHLRLVHPGQHRAGAPGWLVSLQVEGGSCASAGYRRNPEAPPWGWGGGRGALTALAQQGTLCAHLVGRGGCLPVPHPGLGGAGGICGLQGRRGRRGGARVAAGAKARPSTTPRTASQPSCATLQTPTPQTRAGKLWGPAGSLPQASAQRSAGVASRGCSVSTPARAGVEAVPCAGVR